MEPLEQLQPFLRADEQLLWHGTPDPRVLFMPRDVFLVPLSILWCGFAIFWEATAVRGGATVIFWLWGIPFVCVGLYLVVGRFFVKRYRNSRTVYGITTRRAMIAGPRSFRDLPLPGQPVSIRRSRDASHASVDFGGGVSPGGFGFGSRRRNQAALYANTGLDLFARGVDLPFSFYDVAHPDPMLQALDQARSQSPA